MNNIASLRPYSWARTWANQGLQVTVLTSKKRYFDGYTDSELLLPRSVKVIEVPYGGAKVRLRYLIGSGKLKSILGQIFRKYVAKGHGPIAWFEAWRSASMPLFSSLALNNDIVISTFGPAECHLIAADLKAINPALFWVADYRDLWTESITVYRNNRSLENEIRVENKTVEENSDIITTVSIDLKDRLNRRFGKSTYVFRNGFFEEDFLSYPISRRRLGSVGPLRIIYTGTVHEYYIETLAYVFRSLASLSVTKSTSKPEVKVEFYCNKFDCFTILSALDDYKAFFELKETVTRTEALNVQRGADILLLLGGSNPDARGVLTGKVFEYLVSGRPVLCIGSRRDFELGHLLRDTGTGVVFGPDEFHELPAYIYASMSGRGIFDDFKPNKNEILRFSREKSAEDMLSVIQSHLSS